MWWRKLLNHRALSSALLALRLKGLEHLPGRPVIKLTLTGISRYPDNHSYPYVSPTVMVFQNMGRCQSTSTYDPKSLTVGPFSRPGVPVTTSIRCCNCPSSSHCLGAKRASSCYITAQSDDGLDRHITNN
ncbi:hypothetical protein ARMSODRAFT_640459 [Armillaria solidipes]|uniref:Uncharacterized protein n=1 Tax=Armillaria solidipes TaxID=1076256 RepID=A0A2H3CE65_9AGAR|nr:hypothetical protein ARMSODRAFT_640459 [Armillaria solidipes]